MDVDKIWRSSVLIEESATLGKGEEEKEGDSWCVDEFIHLSECFVAQQKISTTQHAQTR
jgi:hypothetical protein